MNRTQGIIKGFSKLGRRQRIAVLEEWLGEEVLTALDSFLHQNEKYQKAFSEFSENYLSNFFLPMGLVPNVLVNNEAYLVPMVIEESSVVAAASRSSRFWAERGGFKTSISGTVKKGQVHFTWKGKPEQLKLLFEKLKPEFWELTEPITRGMRNRGGGITAIELRDKSDRLPSYYQLDVSFQTADAMGANFINTCLEALAARLQQSFDETGNGEGEVLMSILSNHTPESLVRCTVSCTIDELAPMSGSYAPADFARRFQLAVQMAQNDVSRAVTHNKGIYNGIDAVVLATGNDWRAVEAAGHAYAARSGTYSALSEVQLENGIFSYSIEVPLAIGTVGGLTKNHPLAALSIRLLGDPGAERLMELMAALGMANNFSALASLVTSGIQKGHMKMHLANMLTQLNASEQQTKAANEYFRERAISFSAVQQFLKEH
ncbi:hydroxymethylglutaryl-CoA reductase, degradative [Roseimarinus sediminis]|uniref:hydroxymethylglutaryl-CoA reductase, degradative n=1 Tax=Roseimarinus sediminis TaxID=1610899 RepID=UPI003D1D2511